MLGFLNGVPGKLATLVNRLTATWAAKLDTLHDSRLTATWAAKLDTLAANFTSTISGRIDAAITTRAPDTSPLLTPPMASGIVAPGQQNFPPSSFVSYFPMWVTHSTGLVGTSFADVVNITGSGVLTFAGVGVTDAGSNPTIYMDIIIDGVTSFSYAATATSTGQIGVVPVGAFMFNATDWSASLIALEEIPFKSSLQIRVKSSSASYRVQGVARVRRNS